MHYFDENLKQPASEKQLSYAYDLAARQDMDAELLCNIRFDKQYIYTVSYTHLTLPTICSV